MVPGPPRRSVGPRRGRDGPRRRRAARGGPPRLRVERPDAGGERRLADGDRRGRRGRACHRAGRRHQPGGVSRGRRVAPLAGDRGPAVRRGVVAERARRDRSRLRPAAAWGRHQLVAQRGGCCGGRDAAHRERLHGAVAALRPGPGRRARRSAAGLGARGRPARPRRRGAPRRLRRPQPLLDGLVLPRAGRRGPGWPRAGPGAGALGGVRRPGPRHSLCRRPALGDGGRDLRAGPHARRPG